MPRHILLHPGFHKTGTTTFQRGLERAGARLAPHLEVLLPQDIRAATLASRAYSVRPGPMRMAQFGRSFADVMAKVNPADPSPLLISAEGLAGQIPGRRGFDTYEATPALMDRAVHVLQRHFGTQATFTIWFTTREAEGWKRSVWYQNLRVARLTTPFEDYAPQLDRAADMHAIVAKTRARLDGRATVSTHRLEDIRSKPGGLLALALEDLGLRINDLNPSNAETRSPLTPQNSCCA